MRVLAAAAAVLAILGLGAAAPARVDPLPVGITISGVDAHDGQIYEADGVLYWVGTRYGCGFIWNNAATPWCGFGVWTATALAGPWTYVRDLFNPAGNSGIFHNESWQTICRGAGCFNPRMIQRASDGRWVLWFNAGHDRLVYGANEFWALWCAGPAGPCGRDHGQPGYKPALWICNTGGDFSIFKDTDGTAWLVCGRHPYYSIGVERLQPNADWGSGWGATDLAGLTYVEGAGMYRDSDGTYVLTVGPNCPYCSGTSTDYAVASSMYGPWHVPAGSGARRRISTHSCGGQPRTVITLDGQFYEQIDTWYDSPSETNAATRLEPLIPTGAPWLGPVNGQPWVGPLRPFTCG